MSSHSEMFNIGYLKRILLRYYSEQDNNQWLNDINRVEVRRGNGCKKLRTYKHLKFEYKT